MKTHYRVEIHYRPLGGGLYDWKFVHSADSEAEADEVIAEMIEYDKAHEYRFDYRKNYICKTCEKDCASAEDAENCCLDKRLYALYKEDDL